MAKAKPKNGKQRYAKIYRQFTRIKFTKYKLQYPRIRESQIIAKIIKQWQAMDQNAKQDLAQQFIQKSGKGFLQDLSSSQKKQKKIKKQKKSQPLSSSARQSKQPTKKKKGKKISPKVRVFKQKSPPDRTFGTRDQIKKLQGQDFRIKSSQNSKTPGKKSTPQKKSSSSSLLAIKKAKKVSKTVTLLQKKQRLNKQYVSYYKYYYDRLRGQHPRWSNAQLTTIIKLLWKKKITNKKIRTKILTGRQLYSQTKRSQGFLRQQIRQLWRALPHESKKYWQIKGQGRPHRSRKDSGRFVRKILNLGANKLQTIPTQPKISFNWLNQPII